MKKLVIFDLDGTLLNTIADLGTATNYALTQCGYPTHPISAYPRFVGSGITKLLERVLPESARNSDSVEALRVHFKAYYEEHMADDTEPYPGIPELLAQLTARGVAVAVASNKYQAAVEHLINHYFPEIPWAAVEGQKEGIPVKPDPSAIRASTWIPPAAPASSRPESAGVSAPSPSCATTTPTTSSKPPASSSASPSDPHLYLPILRKKMIIRFVRPKF